jgi:hypothetical protein
MAILIKGKNKTNAKHAFVMRKNYKNFGFPIAGYPLAIDMWYEKPYYGRVDHDGNAIYLSEAFLAQIANTGDDTVQAMDFVVDAFHDFVQEYRALGREGVVRNRGALANIAAVKGWPAGGVHSMYRLYEEMLYRVFVRSFLNRRERKQEIISIDSFMKVFVEFIDQMVPNYPVTKSGLILSKYSDPMLSGLMIEVADADHSEDRLKNKIFIKDPNFPIFRKTAAKYGFVIDKNAPWRLVANLNSPKMAEYMNARGRGYSSIFKRCYYAAYRGGLGFEGNDLHELKIFVYGIYNSFVNSDPLARKVISNPSSCTTFKEGAPSSVRVEVQDRERITLENFEQKYGQLYWLKMYMYIRAKENYKNWSEKEFEKKSEKMLQIHKTLDFKSALRYISQETK